MEPWQQRVVDEQGELAARINRLTAFIQSGGPFNLLPLTDQHLMVEQLRLMNDLNEILRRRMARFGVPT